MPTVSKTDPPLAKAEPISDSGSTSGITYLRREKNKPVVQQQLERGVRRCERNNSADTKVREEGGGGAPGTRAEIPLQPLEKTMVRQAVPLQPMEVHGEADIHLQPMEDPTLEQSVPEGLHPMGQTHAGAVGEELQPVGRTHVGEVGGGLSPVGGPPGWSRGRV
ncbi:acid sphingomyelinase-like phosphodiesterase 3b [Grus japonensis]|uniref:Acid sphingomyelinase-like phosphodiesterase 3b n=1 Tax=Grus japonensis TaxID=30415 RepID=A0ABC9Y839_GRUJA